MYYSKKLYDDNISLTLFSKVTNAVIEQIIDNITRCLMISINYHLNYIVLKGQQDNYVINKFVFLPLTININAKKNYGYITS